uniref:Odorant receptor n=1 Tax=Semiothisa cinerearia TaxID=2249628 RepID=A0A889XLA2_9NEOP|nr:odorant receptor [Semiothisa cinerearia]
MGVFVKNVNRSVSLSLTALKLVGFWPPQGLGRNEKIVYSFYAVLSFMFLLGTYLIIQVVDLFLIWGDLPLMTGTAFLLFTNLAQAAKILNIVLRRKVVSSIVDEANEALMTVSSDEARDIVKSCDRETFTQQVLYFGLTVITTIGWATSAESNQLPLRAWYPYDTSKTPAYQLTYVHQVIALFIAAYLNVAKDTLVSTLVAQCTCRLRLLGLALTTLGNDLTVPDELMFTPAQEEMITSRLRGCVVQHQAALEAVLQLQTCFSIPTFAQFTVSLIIICVTAFQLVSQTGNVVRLLSMGTYLLNMCFQVFIYCYQGNQLSEESSELGVSAYQWPWYACGARARRSLLVVMVRTRRAARLTAGGFTALSLASFMAIIKASYSLFTLLQQVEEKK